jgi:hypothetical protein
MPAEPTQPDALGQNAADAKIARRLVLPATVAVGAIIVGGNRLIHLGDPHALLAASRYTVTVIAAGLLLVFLAVALNGALLGRRYPLVSTLNIFISLIFAWPVAMVLVEWADVELDDSPPRRIEGSVTEQVYKTSHARGTLPGKTNFAGIKVRPKDPRYGAEMFVARWAFPTDRDLPDPRAVVVLDWHRGFMRIPWVSAVSWSRPWKSPVRPLSQAEIDDRLQASPLGRVLLEERQRLEAEMAAHADAGIP